MSRRRTRWVDFVQTDQIALIGAAAPGTLNNLEVVSEAELETIGDGATLVRVVGHIFLIRTAGTPVLTGCLWFADAFVGATRPIDWNQDAFERKSNMWSFLYASSVQSNSARFDVDIRTKRKVSAGDTLLLSLQNHSLVNNDVNFVAHLRFLMLLP